MQEKNNKKLCPKCLKSDFWSIKDGRIKCKNCYHIFTFREDPFGLPKNILEEIIFEFILERSTNNILKKRAVSKYKLLKILIALRILMTRNIPNEFLETIKLTSENFELNKKIKNPAIGIFSRKGKVYAKFLPEIKNNDLENFIKNREKIKLFRKWQDEISFVIVLKNKLIKIKEVNGCPEAESFYNYFKRKVSLKGGIRKERLPLFLGEYLWRYNNQKLSLKEQEDKILKLLSFAWKKNSKL